MLLVRNTFKAYLMLTVLAVFAIMVNYLPVPEALHQNSKAVLSGGAKILDPDWRPVPGEKLLPAVDPTVKSPLDMEVNFPYTKLNNL